MKSKVFRRMDSQVAVLLIVMLFLSNFCVFFVCYQITYKSMVKGLQERVNNIWEYLESVISPLNFDTINSKEDMDNPIYRETKEALESVRRISNAQYVYTAKRAADGELVYVVDGLPEDSDEFRYPGDLIEPEIQGELDKALSNQLVMPSKILKTEWGKIFIAYCPVHNEQGGVMGALGLEISAETEYDSFAQMRLFVIFFCIGLFIVSAIASLLIFRRISNPRFRDMSNTDLLTGLKNRNAFQTDLHNLNVRKLYDDYAVIVVDLNNLKGVNDSLGHDEGDVYIVKAAAAIRKLESERVVAYRYGGDEFVVLVRGDKDLKTCEEEISKNFEPSRRDFSVPVSLAIGFARFEAGRDVDLADTQKRADRNMYEDKKRKKELVAENAEK